MDRRLRYGPVRVGLLPLFARIERLYGYARLAKVLLGVYSVPLADGTGSYFDVSRLRMVHCARLHTTRVVKDESRAGSARVAVWDMFLNTVDLESGGRISVIQERVAFDRVGGMPVRCCGETPRHDGVMLNSPSAPARPPTRSGTGSPAAAPPPCSSARSR
jgi:hypothetical protein